MDYKKLATDLLSACEENCADCKYAGDSEFECTIAELAATAITDLLVRAEAAEKRVEELEKSLSDAAQVVKTMQESTIPFYERRAEKAQRERDAAVRHLSSLEVCGYCKNGQCTRRGGTKECKFEWVGSKED